jgi:uncharacterized protein involved in exopolysaccharide biosynthesis
MSSSAIDILRSAAPWVAEQLRKYLLLLVVPPLLCGALAFAWLLVTPQSWKAYQSLLVRDDLLGDSFKPGRFSSLENQKSAQETILHIARKPQVIRGALEALGPTPDQSATSETWLSEQAIEDTRDSISIVAPNGAEFGKTDVVVLSVKSKSRERACRFADFVTSEIEKNLREVRHDQLVSMQRELELSVQQLTREYELIAEKVKGVELAVGSDLPVLRSLLDRASRASDVQRALEQIRQERRAAENELEVARKQLQLLQLIESDPAQFSISSSELLTMQPIFKKLREGLTDAELRLLTESGRYEPGHPSVVHAREVIEQTRQQIRREAQVVIEGLRSQESTAEAKFQRLLKSEQQYDERLARLGEKRVEYETLALEMQKRGETLGKAKTDLAQIQSLAEAAERVSLITRIGQPQADLRPDGLTKKATLLLAILGGLIIGGGLVGLFYEPDPRAPWLAAKPTPSTAPAPQIFPELPTSQLEPASLLQAPNSVEPLRAERPFAWSRPEAESSPQIPAVPSVSLEPNDFIELQPTTDHNEDSSTFTPQIEVPAVTPSLERAASTEPTPFPPVYSEPSISESNAHPALTPSALITSITLSAETPVPPITRAQATTDETPRPALNLDSLKQTLAEAARAAAASKPGGESTGPAPQQNPASANQSGRVPSLTDRLDVLSQSLSSYCDTFRSDFPNSGSPTNI